MQGERQLDRRAQEVLAAVIRQYILQGAPVGSKAVAEDFPESVSPATIRNCMADLEEAGFLSQPHVSAGRVPTDKAYRYYVDRLIGPGRLGKELELYIADALGAEPASPEQLLARSSHVLSEVSQNLGLVMGPAPEEKLLEHIHFVNRPDHRILAVIVSKPDLIENRVVRMDEEISQADLDRAAQYLNTDFRGWSLRAVRVEIFKRLEEMKSLYDQLVSNVAKLFAWGALADDTPGPFFVEGQGRLIAHLQAENIRQAAGLLAVFEEKARLASILNACLQMPAPGVRVFIGGENVSEEMRECTLILAPYRYRHHVVGALGVLGPTRMEYERTIPTVDYVAHLCSKLLSVD